MIGQKAQEIINRITIAFDGVSRGGGCTLHQADITDKYGLRTPAHLVRKDINLMWLDARRLDIEGTWQNVKDEYLEEYCSVLSHADNHGFRYYLPAYMCWSLRNHKTSMSPSVDWPIYSLCPTNEPLSTRWRLERFAVFDHDQRLAIVAYLEYMSDERNGADWKAAREGLEFWTTNEKAATVRERARPKQLRS